MKTIYPIILLVQCFLFGSVTRSSAATFQLKKEQFFIIDSWLIGYTSGFFCNKEKRFQQAWQEANHRAKMDARIWGGLFISDTNRNGIHRVGELASRFTYQIPQTIAGFGLSQCYATFTGKVNKVEYACGATVLNMNVDWPGVALGSYILAKSVITANPNNRMFQHEYGHYLQSKRMGIAYFVRVGLPAILSKGNHDAHPVEVDCNREGFLYFNRYYTDFKNDTLLSDNKGWNFSFNPFPDTIGVQKQLYKGRFVQYIDAHDSLQINELTSLKVKATFIDYASWALIPAPLFVGMVHAKRYNKQQLEKQP